MFETSKLSVQGQQSEHKKNGMPGDGGQKKNAFDTSHQKFDIDILIDRLFPIRYPTLTSSSAVGSITQNNHHSSCTIL